MTVLTDVYDINKVRSDLIRIKFSNELTYLEHNLNSEENSKDADQESWLNIRITKLKRILELIDANTKEANKQNDKIEHDSINSLVFQKSWSKLPIYHKTIKLKEYLVTYFKDKLDSSVIDTLTKEGTELIESKELNTKLVTYDSKNGQITNISALVHNEDSNKWGYVIKKSKNNIKY